MNRYYQLDIYDVLDEPRPYSKRQQNDFYKTPALLTQALLDKVDIKGMVFEPCSGDGAIVDVLKTYRRHRTTLQSDLTWDDAMPRDATTQVFWEKWQSKFIRHFPPNLEWVVTNPPFNQAHLILPLALEYCSVGVAMLLRNSYSEPCRNRCDWLIDHADQQRYRLDVGSPRPKFRKDGKRSDLASVAWFVWLKDWSWQDLSIDPPFDYIVHWDKS